MTIAWAIIALLVDTISASADETTLVIQNAHVFVGNGKLLRNAVVLIQGNRIKSIGKQAQPRNQGRIIDASGMTLMPGLIDVHVHLLVRASSQGEKVARLFLKDRLPKKLNQFLAHGVTTIKSTADPVDLIVPVKKLLKQRKLTGPRLLLVGPAFTSTGGHPAVSICKSNPWCRKQMCAKVDDVASAVKGVRELVDKRVDAIKIVYDGNRAGRTKIRFNVMQAIIKEGHRHGLRVTVHTATQRDALEAIEAGADGLEHGLFLGKLSRKDVGELLKKQGTYYVPTLTVWKKFGGAKRFANAQSNLQTLYLQGVKLALGTDTFGSIEPAGRTLLGQAE